MLEKVLTALLFNVKIKYHKRDSIGRWYYHHTALISHYLS